MSNPVGWPQALHSHTYKDLVNEQEQELYKSIVTKPIASLDAVMALFSSLKYVIDNHIPGAFVECGVYQGGNIELIIRVFQLYGITDREIYLYDTFDGMPKPQDIDVEFSVGPAARTWGSLQEGEKTTGSYWVRSGINEVRDKILPLGYPTNKLHFVQGMVENTIPNLTPPQIALVRFDTDFYSSTKHEFIHLYPRVSTGGIIIIDDYGAFLGSQLATDEYIKENNLKVYLNRVDEHVRLIVKP